MKQTRKLTLTIALSSAGFLAAAGLTSCSMYRNNGRKNFESNAPGQIQSFSIDSATTMMSTSDPTTCWQQPADEALWLDTMAQGNEDVSLTVRKINSDEIEACIVDSED